MPERIAWECFRRKDGTTQRGHGRFAEEDPAEKACSVRGCNAPVMWRKTVDHDPERGWKPRVESLLCAAHGRSPEFPRGEVECSDCGKLWTDGRPWILGKWRESHEMNECDPKKVRVKVWTPPGEFCVKWAEDPADPLMQTKRMAQLDKLIKRQKMVIVGGDDEGFVCYRKVGT